MTPDGPKRTVRIGVITRAHGIRGEVFFRPDVEGSETILDQRVLLLERANEAPRRVEVEKASPTPNGILLRLRGIADRTTAETLRGFEVRLDRSALPPLEEDEFYADDLLGMSVVTPEGASLGLVVRVADTGGVPNLEVEGPSGIYQIPLAQAFVDRIDLEARVITATPAREDDDVEG